MQVFWGESDDILFKIFGSQKAGDMWINDFIEIVREVLIC